MDSARRIVTLTHEFHPQRGGIATYVQEMARATHRLGVPIEVWAPRAADCDVPDTPFPFPVRGLPLRGTQNWSCRIRLARFMRAKRRDWQDAVLHLPEPGPMRAWLYLQYVAWTRTPALVLTLHGSEIELFCTLPHRRRMFRALLGRADRIGVVSRYSRDQLLTRFPEVAHKTVVVHGALRTDLQIPTDAPGFRGAQEDLTILTVGRIHPRKGQFAVLEALALLSPEIRRRATYRLIGPVNRPRYLERVQRFASRHGIRLRYDGVLSESEIARAYRDADIFALTSIPSHISVEGFGLVFLEASAHGLPILAHRTGGVADAVSHEETGLQVDPGDRPALAAALERLIQEPDLRRRLGTNGLQWIRTFDWQETARKLFQPWMPDRTVE